jgi:hypothetical protein
MPAAIPIVLGLAGTLATAGAGITGVAAAIGLSAGTLAAIGAGLSIAGVVAGLLLQPTPPSIKMEDGSAAIKQDIPPRTFIYGEYKIGGYYGYWNSDDGGLVAWLIHASRRCNAFLQDWLDTEIVQFDVNGEIQDAPWHYKGNGYIHRFNYLGTSTQVVDIDMDDWDATCKGHGLCSTVILYDDGGTKTQQKIYPTGLVKYNAVIEGHRIFDPRDPLQNYNDENTWEYNYNQALVILDYLTYTQPSTIGPVPVGFGYSYADDIDVSSFMAAADACDELVAKKDGTFEPRYRCWGAYEATEKRSDILKTMLQNCAGRLTTGPDGKLRLFVGAPVEADLLEINDEDMYSLQLKAGTDILDRVNEVKAEYVSKVLSWGKTESASIADLDAIDNNGLESTSIKLRWCPSETQAQRICKIELKKSNSRFRGTISGNLNLLNVWGERWFKLVSNEIPQFNGIYEIVKPGITFSDDAIVVTYDIQSYDNWFDWNAVTDEQDPPAIGELTDVPTTIPVPTGVGVNIVSVTLSNGNLAAVGNIHWNAPTNPNLQAYVRYREVTPGDNGAWQVLDTDADATSVLTPPLKDNTNYETEVAFYGPRNSYSDFSATVPFTAIADPTPPAIPYNLTANTSAGTVNLSVNSPNDWRSYGVRFYRNSVNNPNTATLIGATHLAGPNQLVTTTDTPGIGDWYYFATSVNFSGIESAKTAGVLAEISPAAPTITSPTPPGPYQTYERRPVIQGTATTGNLVKLYANAVQVGSATAVGGVWSITPTVDLGIGSNSITATQTQAGNESPASGALSVQISAGDSDFLAYMAQMTVKPNFARQGLLNTAFTSLKSSGLWTKIDCLYFLASHDSQASLLNAKAPTTFGLTATSAGSPVTSPTFTVDRGWQGAGAGATIGGYLASSFNPTLGTPLMTQNSNHIAVWNNIASSGAVQGTYREAGGGQLLIACKNPTAVLWCMNMAGSADIPAQTGDGTGFYAHSRDNSATYKAYQGANVLGPITRASAAVVNGTFRVLAGGSGFSNARVAAASWGAALTDTDAGNLRSIMQTYLSAIGAA